MKNSRIKANLFYVSISFLLNESAYFALEGLQSSLNDKVGTQSLSALYSSYVLTSLFLPSLAMNYLQSRKAMALATSAYAVYTIANFYPRWYTLIPAAVILGSSSSVLWSASRVYISDLAVAYADQNKENHAKTTTKFFGVFFAIFSLSMVIGNVMSSVVFQLSSNVNTIAVKETVNISSITTVSYNAIASTYENISESNQYSLTCGLHNCDQTVGIAKPNDVMESSVQKNILYGLFSVFTVIQIGAVLILLLPADDAPKHGSIYNIELTDEENRMEEIERESLFTNSQNLNNNHEKDGQTEVSNTIAQQVFATAKFLWFNNNAKLLIPISLHVGILQSFVFGQFTKYWVTCVLGIWYVGYVAAAFGLGSAVGSYAVGMLTKLAGRNLIMIGATLIEIGIAIGLLIWEPEIANSTWLFFAVSGCYGILFAVHKTILTSVYTLFFPKDKKSASASFSIWDPLGTSIAYAIGGVICNKVFIIIMTSILVFGISLYIIAEYIDKMSKEKKAYNKEDNAEELKSSED
uniref:protein unc-93 homolog A-like n=1 Tax=Styela clava TaxID=7725 RepID=UPI00193AC151|nr:protein unc-93 homolog A-like [Styela clava]XP_039270643.1 protein unc-93 homolog A-like [Styela clava]